MGKEYIVFDTEAKGYLRETCRNGGTGYETKEDKSQASEIDGGTLKYLRETYGDHFEVVEEIVSEYPQTHRKTWKCKDCGEVNSHDFRVYEPGDGDFDSLDYHCKCGRYWKKSGRIEPGEEMGTEIIVDE